MEIGYKMRLQSFDLSLSLLSQLIHYACGRLMENVQAFVAKAATIIKDIKCFDSETITSLIDQQALHQSTGKLSYFYL